MPIHGCEACGGAWLGPDAAVHVMRGAGDAAERALVDASSGVASRPKRAVPPAEGTLACPQCTTAMHRMAVGEVIVDSCPAHGTWCDAGEVQRVVDTC